MLILPKTIVDNPGIDAPLLFLAGPVQGGGNWQERCYQEIDRQLSPARFFAVVPCRWDATHALSGHAVGRPANFLRQTTWEYHYLKLAVERSKTKRGCVIFWLPKESKSEPRKDGQPYARDTLGELGRWPARASMCGGTIFVGAEPEFPGLSVIQHNLTLDFELGYDFPIYPTLGKTVEQAVAFLRV